MRSVLTGDGSSGGVWAGQESLARVEKPNGRLRGAGSGLTDHSNELRAGAPEGARARSQACTKQGVTGLELAMALLKRGFISFPRLVLDYMVDLEMDYELVGKLLVFLSEPELQEAASAFPASDYQLHVPDPHRYRNLRDRLQEFADQELVRFEELPGEQMNFNFGPMLLHLSARLQEGEANAEAAAAAQAPPPHPVAPPPRQPEAPPASDPVPATSFLSQIRAHEAIIKYAEKKLARPLGQREVADLVDWVTSYGFDDRVVRRIIDEGADRGKTRFSYLNQIARAWHEKGIRTLDDADSEVVEYQRLMVRWGRVVQRLGLSRRLTRAEAQLLEKWSGEWGYPDDVIFRACDETIYAKEPTFAYIDRVLEGWRARGVRTVEDAERALAEHKRGRTAGRPAQAPPGSKPVKSNVFLTGTRKEDEYYEQFITKRPGR